jgi:hypothetical protein
MWPSSHTGSVEPSKTFVVPAAKGADKDVTLLRIICLFVQNMLLSMCRKMVHHPVSAMTIQFVWSQQESAEGQ